ncbi:MAG: glycoside hydrolase family 32 protein [Candidatus Acidiferrales bacterium]
MNLPLISRRQFLGTAAAGLAASCVRGAESDRDLAQAMEAVRAAIPLASADRERPIYHFHPPANWNNDPNGPLFYNGWHHLFYQLNPFGATIAHQHWGHARSQDLVNWEHLPIAICPSSDKGERAIFSGGSIVAKDGRPRLIYTSIGHPEPEQWMVEPEDENLISWKKFYGNPVLTSAAHGGVTVNEWRDPFLFSEGGEFYMVCGGMANTEQGGRGQVQLYRATKDDLSQWRWLGTVFQPPERETYDVECPNLFKLDDKWVLIISPNRPCEYFVGTLDLKSVRFTPETHGILDAGDAYASNIYRDDQGRTILWLWGRTYTPPGRGWNGVMTMPRILSIGSDGFLRQHVLPAFQQLRGEPKVFPGRQLGEETVVLDGVPGDAVEIEAEFSAGNFATFGFEVGHSASGQPAATVTIQRGILAVGNARTYVGNPERYKLHLFIDKRCLEVYVNDGVVALYSAIDMPTEDTRVAVFGVPSHVDSEPPNAVNHTPQGVRLESLTTWPMKPASFSLEHFHI